jgi:hypothetical protein
MKERDDTPLSIKRETKKLLVKVKGKLEQKDGIDRSFDDVIKALCEKELMRLFE